MKQAQIKTVTLKNGSKLNLYYFKKHPNGYVYIVAPIGPLFWTTSKTKEEAVQKMEERMHRTT